MDAAEFELKRTRLKMRQWIDTTLARKEAIRKLGIKEENGLGLELCGIQEKELHMYEGLEKLAFYLGLTIKYEPDWSRNDDNYRLGYMSCSYNGWKLFQIWRY